MIVDSKGDILKTEAEALVNTVNCVGVMGRGIALQFKKAFPENFNAYKKVCDRKELKPGGVFVYKLQDLLTPRYILNFATKDHWKGASKIEYIDEGLIELTRQLKALDIGSVAIPPLGCGLGGLDWKVVKQKIIKAFEPFPEVRVLLFAPGDAPPTTSLVRSKKAPDMTPGRAVLLELMRTYLSALMDPSVTLLELHKLMYFTQEAGQELNLRYAKGPYGPYAENLKNVLTRIDGHFISGYGDAEDSPGKEIDLRPEASQQAHAFLSTKPQVRAHLTRVADLISGFETPYGMELLSTVHWLSSHENVKDVYLAIEQTHKWSTRKQMFKPPHIQLAWQVLTDKGWIDNQDGTTQSAH